MKMFDIFATFSPPLRPIAKLKTPLFAFVLLLSACNTKDKTRNILETALASDHPKIKRVMNNIDAHEVQIIYSQIHRKNGKVLFTDYEFQVDSSQYFYPASTVKLPIALLALSRTGKKRDIKADTRFYIEGDSVETTIQKEIQKIFAVSDNDAYNRLFEFLGQDYITKELNSKKIGPLRISHRLAIANADEITTKPIVVYENDSTTRVLNPSINASLKPLGLKKTEKGIGYYKDGERINEAFDFGLKNHFPIKTQHRLLKTVMFPDNYTDREKINLSDNQLKLVHNAMNTLPKDAGYDPAVYYDGYCKFFMYGDTKENIPKHIKIYNKVGNAYGTLTDCAYIKDIKNNVEFLLTATILVNENGIFNDDDYEYDNIGIPFLAQLGREIHRLELDRQ